MCHLVLFLPIIALPAFWLLPLGVAVPLYAVAVGLALWAYWMAFSAMRAPAMTGAEALLHTAGTVRSVDQRLAAISLGGEIWFAEPPADGLKVGDRVEVIGMEGLRLEVKKVAG